MQETKAEIRSQLDEVNSNVKEEKTNHQSKILSILSSQSDRTWGPISDLRAIANRNRPATIETHDYRPPLE